MSLRNLILKGGMYLTARQALGMAISIVGMLLVIRAIGPAAYGLYAATLGLYTYIFIFSQWGIGVYLIRMKGEFDETEFHQAFSCFLILGGAGAAAAILAAPLLERGVGLQGFGAVFSVMALGLPVQLSLMTARARLEIDLDFRRVAVIEVVGQISYFLLALPLAYTGWGAWAPLAGWWTNQAVLAILFFAVSGYRPRLHWNWIRVRRMMGYGLGYSASGWVWMARELVNPFIVARFLGAEAAGFVALTSGIVEKLSFVKTATWRLSIAALAKFQEDRTRLARAISEGMQLQVMALGPILVGFGLVAPWVIPWLFGDRWQPVLTIFPFIALGNLTNALFNLHSSALYVLQRNWEVTVFHLAHVILFAGGAFLLVPWVGLVGYGWAEVAALISYSVLHLYVIKEIGDIGYLRSTIWFFPLAIVLFTHQLGWWTALSLIFLIFWKNIKADSLQLVKIIIPEKRI
ncbi:MAG: polysaccharide biosynthesis protein [Deltaproteobacteria bacterium]|nr:polysaccharide biosynthesis protein [Deltaproteobacteria bacterium]